MLLQRIVVTQSSRPIATFSDFGRLSILCFFPLERVRRAEERRSVPDCPRNTPNDAKARRGFEQKAAKEAKTDQELGLGLRFGCDHSVKSFCESSDRNSAPNIGTPILRTFASFANFCSNLLGVLLFASGTRPVFDFLNISQRDQPRNPVPVVYHNECRDRRVFLFG